MFLLGALLYSGDAQRHQQQIEWVETLQESVVERTDFTLAGATKAAAEGTAQKDPTASDAIHTQ